MCSICCCSSCGCLCSCGMLPRWWCGIGGCPYGFMCIPTPGKSFIEGGIGGWTPPFPFEPAFCGDLPFGCCCCCWSFIFGGGALLHKLLDTFLLFESILLPFCWWFLFETSFMYVLSLLGISLWLSFCCCAILFYPQNGTNLRCAHAKSARFRLVISLIFNALFLYLLFTWILPGRLRPAHLQFPKYSLRIGERKWKRNTNTPKSISSVMIIFSFLLPTTSAASQALGIRNLYFPADGDENRISPTPSSWSSSHAFGKIIFPPANCMR